MALVSTPSYLRILSLASFFAMVIHHNPVSGKWMLAKDFFDYPLSSSSFYEIHLVKHFIPMH